MTLLLKIQILFISLVIFVNGNDKNMHTSKSIIILYANSSAHPKNKHVTRFLKSVIEVTRGTEPICQSWLNVDGHNRSHQLKAAKYENVSNLQQNSNSNFCQLYKRAEISVLIEAVLLFR